MSTSAQIRRIPVPNLAGFWHRRWFQLWLASVVLALAASIAAARVGNPALVPTAFFLGAASGPIALAAATNDETRAFLSLPPQATLGTWLYGGAIGITVAGVLDQRYIVDPHSWRIAFVGFFEEPAKLIVPVALFALGRYATQASGLALALASACGYAIFESLFYGAATFEQSGLHAAMVQLLNRGLMTPFGHMAWTGIVAVPLFGAWERHGRFVLDRRVAAALLAACSLHSLNDIAPLLSPLAAVLLEAGVLLASAGGLYLAVRRVHYAGASYIRSAAEVERLSRGTVER